MTSLAARYAAGEHEAVWRELDRHTLSVGENSALGLGHPPGPAEIEDIMRQTFERVARNTDRVIERLRGIGYRFECEAQSPLEAPRRPADSAVSDAAIAVEDRFGDLPAFQPDAAFSTATPFPTALLWFGQIVGSVDLRQEFAAAAFGAAPASGGNPGDPGQPRLGDWDPLQVHFDYLAYDVSDPARALTPLDDGGLALVAEFAPGFEHKANVSGAIDMHLRLPANRIDPIVFGEGIALPFTTYLRRVFSRGGFFGIPRKVRDDQRLDREVEPGIFLPDHPVFASLSRDLEPF